MAKIIEEDNLSVAWLAATRHLLHSGGSDTNLFVVIRRPGEEDGHIRRRLDGFVADHRDQGIQPVNKVANTIFPQSLYLPKLGALAREHFYECARKHYSVARRHPSNRFGMYFYRLIAWPGRDGEINQLEAIVHRLQNQLTRQKLTSAYEIAVCDPQDDVPHDSSADARVQSPDLDRRTRGFPCLSHISLTLKDQRLHLTALYRNQHFMSRAYGNYLGLSHLLHFFCHEVGCELGELACVATHADAEVGSQKGFGKRSLSLLVRSCLDAAA